LPHNLLLFGVFTVIVLNGVARGFFSPTYTAFFPQLVDKQTLPNAISWNSSTWQVASISGLGVGGLLYGFAGVEWAFGTMTVLLALALLILTGIAPRPTPVSDHSEPAWVRIREGLRFVFSRQLIIASVAMDLFAVLFGGAVALLPVFARDILHVGPQGLGVLRAAMSIGAISTAFLIAHRPLGQGAGKLLLTCVAGFGLCMIGFGLSTYFWLSFACLFAAGVFDEVSVFIRASLMQHLTPDQMKGRVSSVVNVFVTSSNEIGAFESGLAATLMGTVPSVVFGGLMTLLVAGVTWWQAPQLRVLDFRQFNQKEE
jgi:predicted MFS family arabinose efflux permease